MFTFIEEAWKNWPWFDIFSKSIRAFFLLGVGVPLFLFLSRQTTRILKDKVSEQAQMIASKAVLYSGFTLLGIMLLYELGFKLTTLVGAAGILGVAVGFASQTSLSNIISGLFLITEKPFAVGDLIRIGDTLGFVSSINLLSIRLRTSDNQLVRIPNESILKDRVVNITSFPIRRMDIDISVAYKENLKHVIKILKDIGDQHPLCLEEPEPLVLIQRFGASGIDILFGAWFAREDYIKFKNSIMHNIKERFDTEGIEIPFPHLSIYSGTITKPFPVKVDTPHVSTGNEGGDMGDDSANLT